MVPSLLLLCQCFGAIGEYFDDLNVVGIAMASRPKWDMLSVWVKDTMNAEAKFRIGSVRAVTVFLRCPTWVAGLLDCGPVERTFCSSIHSPSRPCLFVCVCYYFKARAKSA